MSIDYTKGPLPSGTWKLSDWQLAGVACRLQENVNSIPEFFDKRRSKVADKYPLLNHGTADQLTSSGNSINSKSMNTVIQVTNAVAIENGMAKWVPPIDLDWMKNKVAPDASWRPHVPDYSLWQNVVDVNTQNEFASKICGLFYLYRAHGLEHTTSDAGGIQRELVCIHQPNASHIRVHLVNAEYELSSGLGYFEGDTFTVTLFRPHKRNGFRSRFLMIDIPKRGKLQPEMLDGVVARLSGQLGTPYASAAKLVRAKHLSSKDVATIPDTLYQYRKNHIDVVDKSPSVHPEFAHFQPSSGLAWNDDQVKRDIGNHAKFIRQAIFRLDQDPPEKADVEDLKQMEANLEAQLERVKSAIANQTA